MARPRYVDEAQISALLKCSLCRHPYHDPVRVIPCGHLGCRECVVKWVEKYGSCFECRGAADTSSLMEDPYTRKLVGELDVFCPQSDDGCAWRGPQHQLDTHGAACERAVVACLHDGCTVQLPRALMARHLDTCAQRRVQCACGAWLVQGDSATHMFTCPVAEVECDACHERMLQREIEAHIAHTCPAVVEPCINRDLGCTYSGPRSKTSEHLAACAYEETKHVIVPLREQLAMMQNEIRGLKDELRSALHAQDRRIDALCDALRGERGGKHTPPQHRAVARLQPRAKPKLAASPVTHTGFSPKPVPTARAAVHGVHGHTPPSTSKTPPSRTSHVPPMSESPLAALLSRPLHTAAASATPPQSGAPPASAGSRYVQRSSPFKRSHPSPPRDEVQTPTTMPPSAKRATLHSPQQRAEQEAQKAPPARKSHEPPVSESPLAALLSRPHATPPQSLPPKATPPASAESRYAQRSSPFKRSHPSPPHNEAPTPTAMPPSAKRATLHSPQQRAEQQAQAELEKHHRRHVARSPARKPATAPSPQRSPYRMETLAGALPAAHTSPAKASPAQPESEAAARFKAAHARAALSPARPGRSPSTRVTFNSGAPSAAPSSASRASPYRAARTPERSLADKLRDYGL